MEQRPLREGDFVSILVNGKIYQYPISAIISDHIIADDYRLEYVNGQWQVEGLPYHHTVSFIGVNQVTNEHDGLTGINDTDLLIMKKMPITDMMSLCKSSTRYAKLCKRDDLWMSRILAEHGPIIYKPKSFTLYQYYVAKTLLPKDAAAAGDINMLYWMRDMGKNIVALDLLEAIEHDRNDFIASGVADNLLEMLTEDVVSLMIKATEKGNLFILKYMMTKLSVWETSSEKYKETIIRIIERAAEHGHLDIIEDISTKYTNILYNECDALFYAVKNNHTNIARWLEERGARYERKFLYKAIESGDFRLINKSTIFSSSKFTQRNIFQAVYGIACSPETLDRVKGVVYNLVTACNAAGQASTRSLQWLYDHGISPDESAYGYAISENRIDSLVWLKSHGIHFTTTYSTRERFLKWKGNLEILDWMVTNYPEVPLPLDTLLEYFVRNYSVDDVDVVQWFISHGYNIIKERFINFHTEHNHIKILKYLQKTLPNKFKELTRKDVLTTCAAYGHLELFQWYLSIGYTPTFETGVMAAQEGYVEIAELCYRNGINFDHDIIMRDFSGDGENPLFSKNTVIIKEWLRERNIQY